MWCVSLCYTVAPQQLLTEVLTTPLRYAPVILREVEPGIKNFETYVHCYSSSGLPAPGDGPSVVRLLHEGDAHIQGGRPLDCAQCGREVAAELRRLDVGTEGEWFRR